MKESWLIQRLKKPYEVKAFNPFVFGAGGGRLTKEAKEVLSGVFEFDYMGAAEFEFGTVPDALEQIYETRTEFTTDQVEFPLAGVKLDVWEKHHYKRLTQGHGKVFVFCNRAHLAGARKLILKLALDGDGRFLKERSNLKYKFLEEREGYRDNVEGWLELDNGFFFFTDETMFKKTVELFGKTG